MNHGVFDELRCGHSRAVWGSMRLTKGALFTSSSRPCGLSGAARGLPDNAFYPVVAAAMAMSTLESVRAIAASGPRGIVCGVSKLRRKQLVLVRIPSSRFHGRGASTAVSPALHPLNPKPSPVDRSRTSRQLRAASVSDGAEIEHSAAESVASKVAGKSRGEIFLERAMGPHDSTSSSGADEVASKSKKERKQTREKVAAFVARRDEPCCYGCGAALQSSAPEAPGFLPLATFEVVCSSLVVRLVFRSRRCCA